MVARAKSSKNVLLNTQQTGSNRTPATNFSQRVGTRMGWEAAATDCRRTGWRLRGERPLAGAGAGFFLRGELGTPSVLAVHTAAAQAELACSATISRCFAAMSSS